MKQTVRIIGGIYRGKKLPVPLIDGLRPTPDRVRETLFNWLMHSIRNSRCLDAFAGSGALGFEALSRGALEVVLLEKDRNAYENLQRVAVSFQTQTLNMIHTDALQYLKQSSAQFNLIFLDPPFSQSYLLSSLDILAERPILVEDGLVYLEIPQQIPINPVHWQILKSKQAGQVVYMLLKKRTLDKGTGSCFNQ
jgi:16S rRNA (guanine966-N2)-methyltransferase